MNVACGANPNAEMLVSGGDQVETANTSRTGIVPSLDQLRQYRGSPRSVTTTWVARRTSSTCTRPTPTAPAPTTARARAASAPSRAATMVHVQGRALHRPEQQQLRHLAGRRRRRRAHLVRHRRRQQHGADAKYTVLVYHHAIYSPADHAKDADNKIRRTDFPTAFSKLGVDWCSGSRPQLLALVRDQERLQGERRREARSGRSLRGTRGVVYVTANSASGSKYYDITSPDNSGTSGAVTAPTR